MMTMLAGRGAEVRPLVDVTVMSIITPWLAMMTMLAGRGAEPLLDAACAFLPSPTDVALLADERLSNQRQRDGGDGGDGGDGDDGGDGATAARMAREATRLLAEVSSNDVAHADLVASPLIATVTLGLLAEVRNGVAQKDLVA